MKLLRRGIMLIVVSVLKHRKETAAICRIGSSYIIAVVAALKAYDWFKYWKEVSCSLLF